MRIVFREGRTKAVGTVARLVPTASVPHLDSHLDLSRARYVLYGVKYADLVSLVTLSYMCNMYIQAEEILEPGHIIGDKSIRKGRYGSTASRLTQQLATQGGSDGAAELPAGSKAAWNDPSQGCQAEDGKASDSHLDLNHSPYILYGVRYIDLVSLALFAGAAERPERVLR